jgi:hypothetical protein
MPLGPAAIQTFATAFARLLGNRSLLVSASEAVEHCTSASDAVDGSFPGTRVQGVGAV